jgi:hypothetical protein
MIFSLLSSVGILRIAQVERMFDEFVTIHLAGEFFSTEIILFRSTLG